jgi:hypothetical protein
MPRDLEYENANIGYDQYNNDEEGIKCKNFELCDTILPMWWYDCKGKYLCTNCDIFNWNELEFRDTTEDCVVCYCNNSREMKFPTHCGHWFCINCSQNILFWDETRYHLSPEPYGCPPCPTGCINPIKGKQCYCEEYDEIQEKWKLNHPEQFKEWNDNDHESIDLSEQTIGSVYSSKTCPLCRKKYE